MVKEKGIREMFPHPGFTVGFRSCTGFKLRGQATAYAVVAHEKYELCNKLEVSKEQMEFLSNYPASCIKWCAKDRHVAERYGNSIVEFPIPMSAGLVATDGEGGYLILFPRTNTRS